MLEHRRTLRLIPGSLFSELESRPITVVALGAEAGVGEPIVLSGLGHPDRIDAGASEHARQGPDRNLIEVGLVVERAQNDALSDNRMLRRDLAQPADRPGMVPVDLVIEPDERVPVRAIFDN